MLLNSGDIFNKIIFNNSQHFCYFSEINTCDINPVHQLFAAGTAEVTSLHLHPLLTVELLLKSNFVFFISNFCLFQGHVECWDPRSRSRVGVLDIGLSGLDYQRYMVHLHI